MELQAFPKFFAEQRAKCATAAEQDETQQLGTRRDELLGQIGATAKFAEGAISKASTNVEGTAKSAEDAISKASTNVEDKANEFDQRYKQLLMQLEQAL